MKTTTSPSTKTRIALIVVLFAAAVYYGRMLSGGYLLMPALGLTTFAPASSILLAALLLTDRRDWWIYIFAGAIPLFLPLPFELGPLVAQNRVIFSFANIAEALVAAFALTSILKGRLKFDQLREMIVFLFWAVLIGPLVAASIASTAASITPEVSFWAVWQRLTRSHALGQLALTPVIILWISGGLGWVKEFSFSRLMEALGLALGLLVVGNISLGMEIGPSGNLPALLYAPLPLLLWAAIRFGPRGVCSAVLFITLLAVWNAVNGRGPFTDNTPEQNVISLQLFLIASSIPLMLLGSLLAHREKQADAQLLQADLALDITKRRLEELFCTMLDGLIAIRADGQIESFNPAAERIFGYTRDEVMGHNVTMLMPEAYAAEHDQHIHNYLATGQRKVIGINREVTGRRKDGSTFPMELFVSEVADNGQSVFTGILRDITEQKQRLAELANAREDAEQANRAKSAFLATMSHEIRTPLNGIIGMGELLELQNLGSDQRRLVKTIRNSSLSLSRIIDDILDFSKIEAGKLEVESVAFRPAVVIESVTEMLTSTADKGQVVLSLFIDPRIPDRICSDPIRLRQILVNLLGNAIKFSGGDSIVGGMVHLRVEMDGDDRVQFKVMDNGIGIDANVQRELFQPFHQGEHSTNRRFGGTGLGLVISQNLARLMGGKIELDSRLGEGSTFTLTLPLVEAPINPNDETLDVSGLRILALLSEGESREIIGSYLQADGATVDFVDEVALEALLASSTAYDVLIVGSDYSEEDQKALIESLRERGKVPRQLLLTRHRSAKLGMQDMDCCRIADAPLMRSALMRSICLLGGRISAEPLSTKDLPVVDKAVPDIAEAQAQGRLILLVEDNLINQQVIFRQLHVLGYAVEIASNGREGFEMWKSGRYGLVLMDCHMPEMDGFESTGAIREQEKQEHLERIPIIAVTANAMQGEADRCLGAGMDDYLSKPIQMKQLSEMLDRWLA